LPLLLKRIHYRCKSLYCMLELWQRTMEIGELRFTFGDWIFKTWCVWWDGVSEPWRRLKRF
jgi:hypothetical protein